MNDRGVLRDRTLVLRILVPGLEARLRYKMKEKKSATASYLDLDGVFCEPTPARNRTLWNFHCDGATYPAKLVNLPCPVEIHKTHDHAAYYKCVDLGQMLIVYEDDMALEEADDKVPEGFNYYPSGLTPPTNKVVERRFAHRSQPPPRAAVVHVEEELLDFLNKLAKDTKRKIPTAVQAKVIEEVVEDVVDYEPWMDDYGRAGIEVEADDPLISLHPEVWLEPHVIRDLREAQQEKELKKKKEPKPGIPKKALEAPMDDVTQAASSMLAGDFELDLDGADLLGLNLDEEMEGFDGLTL